MKLGSNFYTRADVVLIAQDLLGKKLVTNFGLKITSGIIVETEAYAGITDRACHAYNGKFTQRTKIMYQKGGVAYVYLCYGMHHLFNIVTNVQGIPHAVLIRAVEPNEGIEWMLKRRNMGEVKPNLTSGPGSLSKAFGISSEHSGVDLQNNKIWVEDIGVNVGSNQIIKSARVGVAYAKQDALLPYRFRIKNNAFTSKAK